MLTLVDNYSELIKCHKLFEKRIKEAKSKKYDLTLGFHGGNAKEIVTWFPEYKFWIRLAEMKKAKQTFWNPLGTKDPATVNQAGITVEMNYIIGNGEKRGAGFAKDDNGNFFLFHRGNIGGGRKGIGKTLFINNYRGSLREVKEPNGIALVAVVGNLLSERFIRQVGVFVYEIKRIKNLRPTDAISSAQQNRINKIFNSEFSGKKNYKIKVKVSATCDHGLLVDGLNKLLNEKKLKTANDKNRDLYVLNKNGVITAVYEFKTSHSSTDIYTAVGQLLVNNITISNRTKKFIVIPKGYNKYLKVIFEKLNINVIDYAWQNERLNFSEKIY
jgi:hypothetical protein